MWTNKRINYSQNSSRSEVENVDISINFDKRKNIWLKWGRWGWNKNLSNLKANLFFYEVQPYGRLCSLLEAFPPPSIKNSEISAPNSHRPGYTRVYLRSLWLYALCFNFVWPAWATDSAFIPENSLIVMLSEAVFLISYRPDSGFNVVAVKFSISKTFSFGTWMFHVFAQSNDFTAPNSTALGFN